MARLLNRFGQVTAIVYFQHTRQLRLALLAGWIGGAAGLVGCNGGLSVASNPSHQTGAAAAGIVLQNVAAASGIRYRWPEQPRPMRILEAFGRGCGFLDYDDDGWQDILLVGAPRVALFRNQRDGRFEETTAQTGLTAYAGDWRGCAVGDYNGDGLLDLLLTGYHCLALLRNDSGERWRDATATAGLDPHNRGRWGSSAGFMDLDADGWLDLVLLNYVVFGPDDPQYCQFKPGLRSGCPPGQYQPEFPELWRNIGNGRFQEVTGPSGLRAANGKALVLAFADADDDGRIDFYIGNDGMPADLMRNAGMVGNATRAGPRFRNTGVTSGVAYGAVPGEALSAMCADWADYDRDGRLDLIVTAFSNQPYALLHNLGDGLFEHAGDRTGITGPTFIPLGFGGKWLDLDSDGWLDIAFANGHVYDNTEQIDPTTRFRQPLMLFHNQQGRGFVDLVPELGAEIGTPILGRGLATGDYDNDGRVDLLVVDYEGEPLLLRNVSRTTNHWVQLALRSDSPNRFAYGARVTATSGSQTWVTHVSPASSYLSSSDPRVHFGLGELARLGTLTIRWPSGRREVVKDLPVDRSLTLWEGRGAASAGPG